MFCAFTEVMAGENTVILEKNNNPHLQFLPMS